MQGDGNVIPNIKLRTAVYFNSFHLLWIMTEVQPVPARRNQEQQSSLMEQHLLFFWVLMKTSLD